MGALSRLARGLGGRTAFWQALLMQQQGSLRVLGPSAALRLPQVAGLAAAAGGAGGEPPPSASGSPPAPASRLAKLCGKFKTMASRNHAPAAELFYKQYIQEGGEPKHWMLPMLLTMYGRLRQADLAWAIYQELLRIRKGVTAAQAGHPGQAQGMATVMAAEAQAPVARAEAQQAEATSQQSPQQTQQQQRTQQTQQQQQQRLRQANAEGQMAVQEGAGTPGGPGTVPWPGPGPGPACQARLELRQARLAAEAERLVRELRLDALPMDEFAYSALITALSRAEHPPYDLPAHYAAKAAEAFAEMCDSGVQPNVVLWHNLMGCQAKAGLPDAAFATYKAMRGAAGAAAGGATGAPARPTSWTFSILVSACGRACQPQRAADVVDRLMPQAGVKPELPVWNALLGAYGRAGSVDAAYAAWTKMIDSGAIPDDCTERVLALAFASHPALAADVVAEARQIRQQRLGQAAAAQTAGQQGPSQGGTAVEDGQEAASTDEEDEAAAAAAAAAVGQTYRPPYRLHHHRQSPLAIDQVGPAPQSSFTPLAHLVGSLRGALGNGGDSSSSNDSGVGGSGDASGGQGEEPALRQLLLLDLHGSSQAAARMVLLRRLETLVLQGAELIAEVERMEQEWYRQRSFHRQRQLEQQERQRQLAQQRRQTQAEASELLTVLSGSQTAGGSGGGDGSSGSSRRRRRKKKKQKGQAAEAKLEPEVTIEQAQDQQHAVRAAGQGQWPELGQTWAQPRDAEAAASPAGAAPAAPAPRGNAEQPPLPLQQPWQRGMGALLWREQRFSPPAFCIITGMGRHSKNDRGGVLKAAVKDMLQQQGLPVRDDPNNEGMVFVPWSSMVSYLQQQRQAMHTDHFLSAARVRYLYVFAGVAGVVAAANLLPRLAPWMA